MKTNFLELFEIVLFSFQLLFVQFVFVLQSSLKIVGFPEGFDRCFQRGIFPLQLFGVAFSRIEFVGFGDQGRAQFLAFIG